MGENSLLSVSAPVYADAIRLCARLFGSPLELADVEAILRPEESGVLKPLIRIEGLSREVEAMAAALVALGPSQKAEIALNRAFCQLFMGLGGPKSAAPYESAYRGSGRLYQEPAGEMALLLRQQGMETTTDFPEAPDHLVVELALFDDALRLGAVSGDESDMATAEGLRERMEGWVPAFAQSCRDHDRTGFYASAASLLAALLARTVDWPA
ncbi:molecular chaperone TorD family protein [Consotaella salsifontis]|uniref:Tat proofreading chaperone TorD n=1 Tax=Consotaella salsifontis TaxID=1365950 RepID=A0A1T4SU99_9HYPH|nr:molecular chaperone TorD family protein [Consotaella salsifontis]SKA31870.1 Tat proofreading chaperone TorD [Consotaella salsifontis]